MKAITAGCIYSDTQTQERIRVLSVDPQQQYAVAIQMDRLSARPRVLVLQDLQDQLDTHRLIPFEPANTESLLADLSPKQKAWLERATSALHVLMQLSPVELCSRKLWPDFCAAAPKMHLTPFAVNAVFTKYLQGGMRLTEALPRWRKGPRSVDADRGLPAKSRPTQQPGAYALSAADLTNIRAGMKKFWVKGTALRVAHQKFLEHYYPEKLQQTYAGVIAIPRPKGQRPSLSQFYRQGRRMLGLAKRKESALGKRKFRRDCLPSPIGQAAAALRAGREVDIDWTTTGLVCVSAKTRRSIGTLVVYVLCDRFSGLILSIYLTLESASSEQAGRAILLCLEDKVELCRRYGIEITRDQWPAEHLFEVLVADRGEIDSWKSMSFVRGLGLKVKFTRKGMGRDKGSVESGNKMIKTVLRRLEGGTFGRKERMEKNPHLVAIYDIDQVYKILLVHAIAWNNRIREKQPMTADMMEEGVNLAPTPAGVWLDAEKKGLLRSMSVEQARLHTLPFHEASVTDRGIQYERLRYEVPAFTTDDASAIDANAWLTTAKIKRFRVRIGIDPATVDHVWLFHKLANGTSITLRCPLAQGFAAYSGMTWKEYQVCRQEENTKREAKTEENENLDRVARAVEDSVTAEARAATTLANVGVSDSTRLKGIDENRADEIQQRQDAVTTRSKLPQPAFIPDIPQPPSPANHAES